MSNDEKFEQLMAAFTAVGRGGPMRELITKLIDEGTLDEFFDLAIFLLFYITSNNYFRAILQI